VEDDAKERMADNGWRMKRTRFCNPRSSILDPRLVWEEAEKAAKRRKKNKAFEPLNTLNTRNEFSGKNIPVPDFLWVPLSRILRISWLKNPVFGLFEFIFKKARWLRLNRR
jgi:hypothetical protein